MGIPTLQGLQTALSGLMADQEALDVTGQNVANAQTPGYTRQRAVLATDPPITIPALSPNNGRGAVLGTGASLETIVRVHDIYVEGEYREATTQVGNASALAESLKNVETALHEPGAGGLAAQLSNFWNAWNNLASVPTSQTAREAVVAAGNEVAATIRGLQGSLREALATAKRQLEALLGSKGKVEGIANRIAELNGEIKLSEEAGQPPNELIDRREGLLLELAQIGTTTVRERPFGVVTVSFGGAEKPLVEETTVNWPQTVTKSAGGEVGALLELSEAGGRLSSLEAALNGFAETLAKSVNAKQPEGAFFSYTAGEAAATLAVIATASSVQPGPAGQPGANEYARAIAGLRGGEAESLYTAYVTRIGREVQTAQRILQNAEAVQSALREEEQAISGVSIDEEMTNMMALQRGYEASARVLTAMDQMLETLIEHTGVVGL